MACHILHSITVHVENGSRECQDMAPETATTVLFAITVYVDACDDILCALICVIHKHWFPDKKRDSPLPVLIVAGLKAFHTIVSQMLVAMNREILRRKQNKHVRKHMHVTQLEKAKISPWLSCLLYRRYYTRIAYPDPRPYPFCKSSSRRSTIRPAQNSC